jgi:hypothetical protein
MSPSLHDFYLARADDCRRDAAESPLANARDRLLTSEASWRQLAARSARSAAIQAKLVADKEAARAAAALALEPGLC